MTLCCLPSDGSGKDACHLSSMTARTAQALSRSATECELHRDTPENTLDGNVLSVFLEVFEILDSSQNRSNFEPMFLRDLKDEEGRTENPSSTTLL